MMRSVLATSVAVIGLLASWPADACTLGTSGCPIFTAPATTALPAHSSLGGNEFVEHLTNSALLDGHVPQNGWQVSNIGFPGGAQATIYVSDLGDEGPNVGIPIAPGQTYATPPGYKPLGRVAVWSPIDLYVVVREW